MALAWSSATWQWQYKVQGRNSQNVFDVPVSRGRVSCGGPFTTRYAYHDIFALNDLEVSAATFVAYSFHLHACSAVQASTPRHPLRTLLRLLRVWQALLYIDSS